MKIYLDARNITATPSGVARYAQCLIPELVRQAPRHEYVVIRHTSNREPLGLMENAHRVEEAYVDMRIDNLHNVALGTRTLRRVFGRFGRPDVYHSLFHLVPIGLTRAAGESFKKVVTLHDLVWIDHPHESQSTWLKAETMRWFARLAIPYALRTADHVISVSEPTEHRARGWLEGTDSSVIYHGVGEAFFEESPAPAEVIDDWQLTETPYLVAIANDKPYKNLRRVISAFEARRSQLEDAHLVLIGSCEGLRPHIASLNAGDRVHLTGFLEDEQLRAVLSAARAFIFPSLVEGFGLPVLEAMAAGVPTIVSDRDPMRAVAGGAARLVDPEATDAIAEAIHEVMTDPDLRDDLRTRGEERTADFRWSTTAAETLRVYDGGKR